MLEGVQKLVDSAAGSMICAAVDITKLPEAAQAFGMSGVPAGVAVLGGRPSRSTPPARSVPRTWPMCSRRFCSSPPSTSFPAVLIPPSPEDEKPAAPALRPWPPWIAATCPRRREAYRKAIAENPRR